MNYSNTLYYAYTLLPFIYCIVALSLLWIKYFDKVWKVLIHFILLGTLVYDFGTRLRIEDTFQIIMAITVGYILAHPPLKQYIRIYKQKKNT